MFSSAFEQSRNQNSSTSIKKGAAGSCHRGGAPNPISQIYVMGAYYH
jgi:hypothetical protein